MRYKTAGEDKYLDLANLLPQLVVELEVDGRFSFINDAGLKFIGYSKFDLKKGLNIFDLIHSDDLADFKEDFLYLLEGGINKGQEFRMVTKSGEVFFMVFFLKLRDNNHSLHHGLRGFIIDISDRKRLERKVLSAVLETEDRERRRYSEDLHDGLGPLLSTIKLYVNQMKSQKVSQDEESEMFNYANELLDEAILTTRNIANNILPGSIVDNGLIAAVNFFCHQVIASRALAINFSSNTTLRFEQHIESNTYRIIIELLNNTIKHANAKNVTIQILLEDNFLLLKYNDDGVGYEDISHREGLGMGNIKNRANSLNAISRFQSEKNKGMLFDMRVPLEKHD
jgi:PAS domain S-box-containing protein